MIDLRAGAHIICCRLTYVLSPKHIPVITEDRHSYDENTNPDPPLPLNLVTHSLDTEPVSFSVKETDQCESI